MAGLLGQYETTFTRNNPSMGLVQGLESGFNMGSRYALALRQQRMQEEEQARIKAQQEKASDVQMMNQLMDMYSKVGSAEMKKQIGQQWTNLAAKYNPALAGTQFVPNQTADKFMSRARKSTKMLGENFDTGMNDINNLMQEMADEEAKGNIEDKQVEQVHKIVNEGKKDVASQMTGQVLAKDYAGMLGVPDVNSPEYQTPEAQKGLADVAIPQTIGRVASLDQPMGMALQKAVGEQPNKLSETEVMGSSIPPNLRKGMTISPDKTYRVMRDQEGKISNVVGEAKPGFGMVTPITVVDTKNNNNLVSMSREEMLQTNQREPNRYVEAQHFEKISKQAALLGDIRGAIKNTTDIINKTSDLNFSAFQRAKLKQATNALEPSSAISNLINGEFGKSLTPAQQDYLVAVQQLAEQAMAMRSVLGAGQSSEMLRGAILRTIPSETTFNKDYALKQLKHFSGTLDRLERGIPKVQLRNIPDTSASEPVAPTTSKFKIISVE